MKRILIAEDEKSYSMALEIKLTKLGFEPTIVEDGGIAMDLLAREKYDLLILDIRMPKHDGYEVLDALRRAGSTMPVIVLSNLDQTAEVDRAKKAGAKVFLSKSNATIAETVQEVLRQLGDAK